MSTDIILMHLLIFIAGHDGQQQIRCGYNQEINTLVKKNRQQDCNQRLRNGRSYLDIDSGRCGQSP